MLFPRKFLAAGVLYIFCGWFAACNAQPSSGNDSAPVKQVPGEVLEWTRLPQLPAQDGIAGAYSGVCGGALVVAGGAGNAAMGGKSHGDPTWRDTVYILPPGAASWREAGRLPQPSAFGLSLPWKGGFVIIGGANKSGHLDKVWLAAPDGASVKFTELPSLPEPRAMHTGAVVKNHIYITGGLESPGSHKAARTLWRLDMNNIQSGWAKLEPCPGEGRIMAQAGAQGDTLYIFGGKTTRDAENEISGLRDAWAFHAERGWTRLADAPAMLPGSAPQAMALGQSHLALFPAINSEAPPGSRADHSRRAQGLVAYHTITNTWVSIGSAPVVPSCGSVSAWNDGYMISDGSDVWRATPMRAKAAFGWINYSALGAYLIGMVAIGWLCSRRNKSTDDYFRAGGRIPWWAAGMAIYATMLSSLTFMALPAKAYATDWTYIWVNASIFLIAPVIIAIYLPFYRRLNVTSAYEYLEKRFSLPIRLYGSAAFILVQLGRQAVVLLLPSLALSAVCDLDVRVCIVLMGVLCVLYTVMGGIEAVIWTDVAQTVLLLGAALASLVLILLNTDGGLSGFWGTAVANNKLHMFNWTWSPTVAANAFWVVFFGNIFSQLVPYTSDQSVVQRYMTTGNEKKAARSIWFNAILSVPSTLLFFAIGTALFVYYHTNPEKLDLAQPTDAIFPVYIVRNLPVGVAGLVIAGIFAAAQSTVSGSVNSVVTAAMTDFYGRLGGKAKGAAALRFARIATAIVGIFATAAALLLARLNLGSLWDAYSSILGLTASGLAGLFTLGIFTRRAGGIAALLGAAASAIVLYIVQRYTNLHFFLYAGTGMGTCFIIGWIMSFIFPAKKSVKGLTVYTLRR